MAIKIKSFSIGSRLYPNEDKLFVQELPSQGAIAVMTDGMGGLSLGDVAADIVTRSIADYIISNYVGTEEDAILKNALKYADLELRRISIKKRSNMGTAVAVAIIFRQALYYSWQGNVRIYLHRNGITTQLTQDHIANIGYGKTALTRCIKGAGLRSDLPSLNCTLEPGDKVLICTDGLYSILESNFGEFSMDWLQKNIGEPEDDASLIMLEM